jgi:hypothetical protein
MMVSNVTNMDGVFLVPNLIEIFQTCIYIYFKLEHNNMFNGDFNIMYFFF